MIVDIQGVQNVLTDPVIHSLDKKSFDDSSNFQYEGILAFFRTHRCNKYCANLGLLHPKNTFELPNDFSFFSSEKKNPKPQNMFQQINKICDLCKEPFGITAGELYDKTN